MILQRHGSYPVITSHRTQSPSTFSCHLSAFRCSKFQTLQFIRTTSPPGDTVLFYTWVEQEATCITKALNHWFLSCTDQTALLSYYCSNSFRWLLEIIHYCHFWVLVHSLEDANNRFHAVYIKICSFFFFTNSQHHSHLHLWFFMLHQQLNCFRPISALSYTCTNLFIQNVQTLLPRQPLEAQEFVTRDVMSRENAALWHGESRAKLQGSLENQPTNKHI